MHLFPQAQVLLGSVYQKHFSLSAIKANMPVHEQGLEAVEFFNISAETAMESHMFLSF